MNNSSRDIAIDVAKGIAIILMVIGHALPLHHPVQRWIYSFHMPLFFVMAGMTFVPKSLNNLFTSSAKRLLIPYLCIIVANILVNVIVGNEQGVYSCLLGGIYPDGCRQLESFCGFPFYGGVAWFLLALFWCRLIFSGIYQLSPKWYLPISVCSTILCGYIGKYFFNLPFAILVGVCSLGYMSVGKYISGRKDEFVKIPVWFWILFIPIWIYSSQRWYFEMFGFNYLKRMYVMTMLVAIVGSLLIYRLSQYVTAYKHSRKIHTISILQWCGVNSLLILFCHQLTIDIMKALKFCTGYNFSNFKSGILLMVGTVIMVLAWFGTKKVYGYFKIWIKRTLCYSYQPAQNGWVKEMSCVYGNNQTGSVFDPFIYRHRDGTLSMLVSERLTHGVDRLESTDGINWERYGAVISRVPYTWQHMVNRAVIVEKDEIWHMWYTGQSPEISCIGHSISKDGQHFDNAEKPCMKAELDFEGVSVMNPCVLWSEEKGVFQMWYAAGENYEPDVLCYAESVDGDHWTKWKEPVLTKYKKHRWEQEKVGGCDVVREEDGTYTMYYIGYQNVDLARICYAKSTDGIHWIRPNDNLLISPSKNSWDADACYKPSVQKIGNKLLLWYNGRKEHEEYIGLATKQL